MNYPNYIVQSQNISNKSAHSIEKYVRNVVDDVVNSHGVVVKNAFSMLWSGRDTNLRCISLHIGGGRNFQEQCKIQK